LDPYSVELGGRKYRPCLRIIDLLTISNRQR
jgi:hypothetical protein